MTLEGPRVLSKDVNSISVATDGTGEQSTLTGSGDFTKLTIGSLEGAVYRDYFDLSGYMLDDLTTFINGVMLQEGCVVTGTTSLFTIHDILSTEYLTDTEIVQCLTTAPASTYFHNQFGFPTSTLSQQQIIYGRMRVWSSPPAGVNVTLPTLVGDNIWGTGTSTTREKLFITRIVLNHTPASSGSAPPANYMVNAIIAKEDELPYLMRQKRSYELAKTVD